MKPIDARSPTMKHINPFQALEELQIPVKRDNSMQALCKVYNQHLDDKDLDAWFIRRILKLYKVIPNV